jgi:hypothetical protein
MKETFSIFFFLLLCIPINGQYNDESIIKVIVSIDNKGKYFFSKSDIDVNGMVREIQIVRSDESKIALLKINSNEIKNLSINGILAHKKKMRVNFNWGGGNYIYFCDYYFYIEDNRLFLKKKNIARLEPNKKSKKTKIHCNIEVQKTNFSDIL